MRITPLALRVPGLVAYRPAAVAAGVAGGWLLALITASFWLRKRMGIRNWRRLHWATYAIFAAATAHGLAAGTDTPQPWAFAIYLGAIGSVAAAAAWRSFAPPLTQPRRTAR